MENRRERRKRTITQEIRRKRGGYKRGGRERQTSKLCFSNHRHYTNVYY